MDWMAGSSDVNMVRPEASEGTIGFLGAVSVGIGGTDPGRVLIPARRLDVFRARSSHPHRRVGRATLTPSELPASLADGSTRSARSTWVVHDDGVPRPLRRDRASASRCRTAELSRPIRSGRNAAIVRRRGLKEPSQCGAPSHWDQARHRRGTGDDLSGETRSTSPAVVGGQGDSF